MHKPNVYSQPHGFSFNEISVVPSSTASATSNVFSLGSGLRCFLQPVTRLSSYTLTSSNNISLGGKKCLGFGVQLPFNPDVRECYNYSVSGYYVAAGSVVPMLIFGRTNADAHTGDVAIEILSYLPLDTCYTTVSSGMHSYKASGFLRPPTLGTAISGIDNWKGLVLGLFYFNGSAASNIVSDHGITFDTNYWDSIDNELILPVQ